MSPSQPADPEPDRSPAQAERREARRRAERRRMAKHGGGLRRVYRDAVLKRASGRRWRKR
ncbi:MAG: hypothetical protein IIB21_04565 [Chloroflexi bacterium]|nr:hypothetical protein [Chloroflexota bacterium]